MLNRSASLAMSTCVLKALPGNLISKDTHLVFSMSTLNSFGFVYVIFVSRFAHVLTLKRPSTIYLLPCQPRVTVTPCFVYDAIRDLESIDHMCINPIQKIGLIRTIDSRWLKRRVQVNVLLYNYEQKITSLSLLVGSTVV